MDQTHDALSTDGQLFRDQVRKEIFTLKSRATAKQIVENENKENVEIPEGILADDPLPAEPPELIPGILLRHGATGIIGQKEAGKSLIGLEIQHSLLTGYPLWGSITPTTTLDKTAHILAEHTSSTLQQLYHRTGLSGTGRLKIYGTEHLKSMKLMVSNGVRREEAIDFYKKLVVGVGLVVFDPLAAFIQGQSAENDNAPMRSLIDSMIEIAESANAACLILGHQGKPLFFQGREMKKGAYRTRGASSSEDAMTAVHYLEKMPGTTVDGKPVYSFEPTHFKGKKIPAIKLLRDPVTCLHTIGKVK